MSKFTLIGLVFILGFASSANDDSLKQNETKYFYTIESGDDLGSLMFSMGFSPLWGDNGYVQKLVSINEGKIQSNGNLYFKSDKIVLPARPFFLCNVIITDQNVKVKHKVKTVRDYNQLINSFDDKCRGNKAVDYKDTVSKNKRISTSQKTPHVKETENIFKRFGKIKITPRSSFSKVDATDIKDNVSVSITSKLNYAVRVSWEQVWAKRFETNYSIDIERQSYMSPKNRILEKDSLTLINFGVGAKYMIDKKIYLNSELAYGEESYLTSATTQTIGLTKASSLKTTVGLGLTFADFSPFSFGAEFGGVGLLGTKVDDYNTDHGFGYYGSLFLNQKIKNKVITGGIKYQVLDKGSNYLEQKFTDVRFYFGISWEFGNDK